MAGSAASVNEGRFPLRQFAYSVNWLTTSTSPPTSAKLRFVLPCASSKTRILAILRHSRSASASVSPWPTPRRMAYPFPMAPTARPSTVTDASLTHCTTARIDLPSRFRIFPHAQLTPGNFALIILTDFAFVSHRTRCSAPRESLIPESQSMNYRFALISANPHAHSEPFSANNRKIHRIMRLRFFRAFYSLRCASVR